MKTIPREHIIDFDVSISTGIHLQMNNSELYRLYRHCKAIFYSLICIIGATYNVHIAHLKSEIKASFFVAVSCLNFRTKIRYTKNTPN